jgi:hypothetical protein
MSNEPNPLYRAEDGKPNESLQDETVWFPSANGGIVSKDVKTAIRISMVQTEGNGGLHTVISTTWTS